MSFSISIFLYIYLVILFVYIIFSIFNLFHILKYSFNKYSAWFWSWIYIGVVVFILLVTVFFAWGIDWKKEVVIFEGGVSSNNYFIPQ